MSRPCQACPSSVLLNHNHLSLRARLAFSMHWTPSPPWASGRHTRFQFTWQFPPFASLRPVQRNPRCILPISFRIFFGGA
jgi:hypothetical protein